MLEVTVKRQSLQQLLLMQRVWRASCAREIVRTLNVLKSTS